VRERLTGFEPRPGLKVPFFEAEVRAFRVLQGVLCAGDGRRRGRAGRADGLHRPGQLSRRGGTGQGHRQSPAAAKDKGVEDVFMPSIAPKRRRPERTLRQRGRIFSRRRQSDAARIQAIATPAFKCRSTIRSSQIFIPTRTSTRGSARPGPFLSVEAINEALRGIPAERVRFHTCYGINEGPRIYDSELKDVVGTCSR